MDITAVLSESMRDVSISQDEISDIFSSVWQESGLTIIVSLILLILSAIFIVRNMRKSKVKNSIKNINIKDINLENNIYKKQNNIKLDLGAIAKGYTTELVGKYLEDNNIHSYIINAGGNVKVGKAYKKEYYKVGIADPLNPSDIFIKLNINNKSVVTSGDYQRYCTMDNINYNHIINPNTKYPSNYMHSVSVVSSSSSLADIYSTYLFLLPVEEGQLIVDNTDDIEAIWYIDENNIVKSRGFNYE